MSNPILIPYGKGHIECNIPHNGLLTSRIDTLKSDRPGVKIVEEAIANPIGSKPLRELAKGKKTCTIIISDHTRPVPSRDILPPMLEELRKASGVSYQVLTDIAICQLYERVMNEGKLSFTITRKVNINIKK